MNKINKNINNGESLKVWFWTLVSVFVFCLFSYGFCVRGAIVNIVARQNMETELSALNTKVVNLEADYIKAKNNVTPELAVNMGFVTPANHKFITRNVKTQGLSLVTPGI